LAVSSLKTGVLSRSMLVGNTAYIPPITIEYLVIAGGGSGGGGQSGGGGAGGYLTSSSFSTTPGSPLTVK
jgi:hypothetical protein